MPCSWTRGPDGKWAVSGPLEELRQGSVMVQKKSGAQVQAYVGTPIQHGKWWIAYPIKSPVTEAGGSWWFPNWRKDFALPTKDRAANTRPTPALKPIDGGGSGLPVFGVQKTSLVTAP